jgi:hypothetical protein
VIVGVDNKALGIKRFEQDHPNGGLKIYASSSERARVRLLILGYYRRVEPTSKLLEGIGGHVILKQRPSLIFLAGRCKDIP